MYIERDAKIIIIHRAVIGLVIFVAFIIALIQNQQTNPNENFDILQPMIFGIIFILTVIIIGTMFSLKREISKQQEYLQNLPQKPEVETPKKVKIPYNKSGLYSLIIASLLGIIAFIYLYTILILSPQQNINENLEMVSTMILVFVVFFVVVLLVSFFLLLRRIHTPLYFEMKSCPRCGSGDIHKVEFSWWGGIVGPGLVHQVRCKKCGMTYDGVTGTKITKRVSAIVTAFIIISLIITAIRFLYY